MAVPLIAVPVRLNALDVFSPIAFTVSFSLRNGVGWGGGRGGREEGGKCSNYQLLSCIMLQATSRLIKHPQSLSLPPPLPPLLLLPSLPPSPPHFILVPAEETAPDALVFHPVNVSSILWYLHTSDETLHLPTFYYYNLPSSPSTLTPHTQSSSPPLTYK